MAESASGQGEANPAVWVAARAEKMGPARLSRLEFFALVPKEKVISKVMSKWLDAGLVLFCVFIKLNYEGPQ